MNVSRRPHDSIATVAAILVASSALAFENGEIVFDVPLGNVDTWIAQQGTGTVVKAGAGGLTLTDPALFGGTVVLQEGALTLAAYRDRRPAPVGARLLHGHARRASRQA